MPLSELEKKIIESEYWLKLAIGLDDLTKCMLDILHREQPYRQLNYTGLPRDMKTLYITLSDPSHKSVINKLRKKNVIRLDQYNLLYPANQETDSSRFDMTLILILIRNFSGLKTSNNYWDIDSLSPLDTSLASQIVKVIALRNKIYHYGDIESMQKPEFDTLWLNLEEIAHGMNFSGDLTALKAASLDPDNVRVLKACYHQLLCSHNNLKTEVDENKKDEMAKFDEIKKRLAVLSDDLDKYNINYKSTTQKVHMIQCNMIHMEMNMLNENIKRLAIKDNEHNQVKKRKFEIIDKRLEEMDEKTSEKFNDAKDKLKTLQGRTDETSEKLYTLESEHNKRFCKLHDKLHSLESKNEETNWKLSDRNEKLEEENSIQCSEERDDKHLNASAEVLNLVASNIGKDWKLLADSLDLKFSILHRLQPSNENEMLNYFIKTNILWHKLKKSLQSIKRHDIIDMICQNCNHYCNDAIHTTNHLQCNVRSHASAEISEVNQQQKLKLLKEYDTITYVSCGEKHTMTLKEWDKTCIDYFKRYYEPQEKLLFPPQKCGNIFHEKLMRKLMSYLDPEEGNICLFAGYNLLNHVRLHIGSSETYKEILKDLLISSDEELQSNENRLLLFNIKHKVILNIRITESKDTSSIFKEERTGRSDLKLLLFLNRRFIKATGLTLANVVFSPNICINASSLLCKNCIVVDKRILNADEDDFRRWWKVHVIPKTIWKDGVSDTSLFIGIISTIFGFMGTKQVNMKNTGYFPKFRRDNTMEGEEHIEITNLMFTYDQSRVIDDPALKKIVFGGFGAGKSLIGQCHLQELARQEANTTNHTFYICWDNSSIIHLGMKKIVKEVKKTISNQNFYAYNLRELAEVFLKQTKIPSISELFEEIHKKCHGTAHLIIDEFNLENLDNNQAINLNTIFKRAEWKPSIVLLLPQSLEKQHIVISDGIELSKSDNTTSYRFIDSIKCFTLRQHLRSTKSNFFFHKMSTTIITTEVTNSINHSSSNKTTMAGKRIVSNTGVAAAAVERKDVVATINDVAVEGIESSSSIEPIVQSVLDKQSDDLCFQAPVNLDELQVYKTSSDYPNRTDTVYYFRKCEKIGHGIEGTKPKFIHLNHAIDTEAECIAKLILVLQKHFFADCERLYLCKVQKDFQLCLKFLKLSDRNFINYHPLSGYRLVDDKEDILEDIPNGYDIITDNKGARGLEYQQVVVFIPSGNSNHQQAFLETISRCTSDLVIIFPNIFDIKHPQQMPPVIHQILSEAIHQNLIQECVICDCEIDDTDDVISQTFDNGKDYFHINHNSKKYKQLFSQAITLDPVQTSAGENNYSPFDAPTGLKCMIEYGRDDHKRIIKRNCKFTWKQGPFDFIVTKKHLNSDHVEFTSKPTSSSSFTFAFEDMIEGDDYIFSVSTTSSIGKSLPTSLPWRNVDLFDVIIYDDFETLKTTIDIYPWRLYDEDMNGYTLYHYAAYNKPSILQYLLRVDKKYINKVNRLNRTPLYRASRFGNIESVDILLSHGADCSVMDEDGKTAYDVVCGWDVDKSNKEKIKQMLLNKMIN